MEKIKNFEQLAATCAACADAYGKKIEGGCGKSDDSDGLHNILTYSLGLNPPPGIGSGARIIHHFCRLASPKA